MFNPLFEHFRLPHTIETQHFFIRADNGFFYERLEALKLVLTAARLHPSPPPLGRLMLEWTWFRTLFPDDSFTGVIDSPELPMMFNFCRGIIRIGKHYPINPVIATAGNTIHILPYADEIVDRYEKTGREWIRDIRNGAVIEDEFEDFMLLKQGV